MSTSEVWSKTDADRKLVENNTAKAEADAFQPSSWPRFALGIATAFFGLGSAAITWEELIRVEANSFLGGLILAVPIVLPYAVGFYLVYLSLNELREDDRKRRETYHYLFGGAKYSSDTFRLSPKE